MIGKIIMTVKFLSVLPSVTPMVKESLKLPETQYFYFRQAAEQELEERFNESIYLDAEHASFYKNNTLSILGWARFAREKFTSAEAQGKELNELVATAGEQIKNIEENTVLAEEDKFEKSLIELKERLGEIDYKLVEDFLKVLREYVQAEDGSEDELSKLGKLKEKEKEVKEKFRKD